MFKYSFFKKIKILVQCCINFYGFYRIGGS